MNYRSVVLLLLLLHMLPMVNLLLLLPAHPRIIHARKRKHAWLRQNGAHHSCHCRLLRIMMMKMLLLLE